MFYDDDNDNQIIFFLFQCIADFSNSENSNDSQS